MMSKKDAKDAFDGDVREMQRILTQIRRLATIAANAGRGYSETVTVGEVAKAARVTPEHVVAMVGKFGAWMLAVDEREGLPMSEWWVYQDGE
jgi:hypothetical protein